ncbi:MAG: Clp protease N-terminal domain-containing protein [Phycisphaerae bacterium]
MFEHFTDHAKRVLELEGIEAQRMHHDYLGTEHLLLALIREPEGHGHRALEAVGVDIRHAREALAEIVEPGPDVDIPEFFHQTPHIKHVMSVALDQARQLRSPNIGTEHLLLALLDETEGVAVRLLDHLGVQRGRVREEVISMLEAEHATS